VKFKYFRSVFTSDGRRNKKTDSWIDKAHAVLREFYRSVLTQRKLSNTTRLVGKAISFYIGLCPMLTYGREACVVADNVLSQYKRHRGDFWEQFIA